MADIDVTTLPAYTTPTSSDHVIVIKDADSTLNDVEIGDIIGLVPTPSAADVGAVAVAQGVGHSGEFLVVGSDGNVTTVTLATWQGGSY